MNRPWTRDNIVEECVETERNYCESLQTIVDVQSCSFCNSFS